MQPSSSPCDSPDTEVVDGGMDHVVSCSPEIVAHMDLHGAIVGFPASGRLVYLYGHHPPGVHHHG